MTDLVVLHTSCRKAHGGGRDSLETAGAVIGERVAAGASNARPHLLVLSGDQIYADEVAAPLAPRVRRIAGDLVGIDESDVFPPVSAAGRQGPTEGFGLTSSAASDHLWSLGEYLATYLLYWSDALWPAAPPPWSQAVGEVDPAAGLNETTWDDLVARVTTFRAGLPTARRVLATVPSLMIADDHEVTDDWNLDHGWARAVYSDAAGSRLVFNGLLAYALCQHWGNVPERFVTGGSPEADVLAMASFTGASPDTPALRGQLGMPATPFPDPPTVLRDPGAGVAYDVRLDATDGWPVRVIGLDERTVREFPDADGQAARISLDGLAAMLPEPAGPAPGATVVIAPSPVLGTHVIEHVLQPAVNLLPGGSVYADFESWPAAPAQHQELLRRVAAQGPTVILSGDVHYSGTAGLEYVRGPVTTTAAQVTSSAAKNADTKTMMLHLFGDLAMRLGIERTRTVDGYTALSAAQQAALVSPPPAGSELPYDDMVDVLLGRVARAAQETPALISHEVAVVYGLGTPDWTYEVEPVDDERMPAPGALLDAMTAAPDPWPGWDPAKSSSLVRALRASDLHRIGRMFVGLPQISILTFTSGPLTLQHELVCPAGEDPAGTGRHDARTAVVLAP
ncbi:hypothetical protein ACFPK1_32245 [Actinomycetospora rhizophila]|uniref:PhoD-like phosphatase metallophosphatase domain-containing protein n=1 Tax=Actinomycetospora rhizophila TaxID=1416876 RepID=A0ABV9ZP87_9PSEU